MNRVFRQSWDCEEHTDRLNTMFRGQAVAGAERGMVSEVHRRAFLAHREMAASDAIGESG